MYIITTWYGLHVFKHRSFTRRDDALRFLRQVCIKYNLCFEQESRDYHIVYKNEV